MITFTLLLDTTPTQEELRAILTKIAKDQLPANPQSETWPANGVNVRNERGTVVGKWSIT